MVGFALGHLHVAGARIAVPLVWVALVGGVLEALVLGGVRFYLDFSGGRASLGIYCSLALLHKPHVCSSVLDASVEGSSVTQLLIAPATLADYCLVLSTAEERDRS